MRVARNAGALTKSQLIGWFGLTSLEADALPRSQYVRLRGPGFYFLYRAAAFDRALDDCLVSAEEWEARLRARGSAATTSQGDLVKMGRRQRGRGQRRSAPSGTQGARRAAHPSHTL